MDTTADLQIISSVSSIHVFLNWGKMVGILIRIAEYVKLDRYLGDKNNSAERLEKQAKSTI